MPPPDPDDADDAALIERSWRDPEAFAWLYDRHAARLHRYAARRLGGGHADDIVADTFLAAFRKRHRYDVTVSDARPWLYGIAANLIGKHGRSEVRMLRAYARTGADPVLAGISSGMDEADGRISSAAVKRELAAALAGLTVADRDVLLMIAWADLSYAEVATALGIPVGTVRSRLHRARSRIRAALGGQDPTSVHEESLP
ncbi:MAG TPA: RNA polymerase sigma factor [Trebonia sp.]|jgi:RNA polymerase sigma-70 factor (ECF subfamily)